MLLSRTAKTMGLAVDLVTNVIHEPRTQTARENLGAHIEQDKPWLAPVDGTRFGDDHGQR